MQGAAACVTGLEWCKWTRWPLQPQFLLCLCGHSYNGQDNDFKSLSLVQYAFFLSFILSLLHHLPLILSSHHTCSPELPPYPCLPQFISQVLFVWPTWLTTSLPHASSLLLPTGAREGDARTKELCCHICFINHAIRSNHKNKWRIIKMMDIYLLISRFFFISPVSLY